MNTVNCVLYTYKPFIYTVQYIHDVFIGSVTYTNMQVSASAGE